MTETEINTTFLSYARAMTVSVVLLTLGQASTGLSSAYGYETGPSHAWSAQLGLIACLGVVVFVMMSKTDNSKLKGMSFGLLVAWLIQYGMGEMFENMTWISLIHGIIAMGILLHGMALVRAFSEEKPTTSV
ncbi:MAG: hypothetical protein L7S56_04155 [Candidatus Poseidonia sp.]|nr:hypothetical protein [Poseidonia sp.]